MLLTCGDGRSNDGLTKKTPRSVPVTCRHSLLLASTQWTGCVRRVRMIAREHRAGTEAHGIGEAHQVPVEVSLCLAVDPDIGRERYRPGR